MIRVMRSVGRLRERLARRNEIGRIIRRGKRRFSGDPRFNFETVERGFLPRVVENADDTVLLGRICNAWSKAMERQSTACETFQPHQWWCSIRDANLKPVIDSLAAHDVDSLRRMYRNFFRDPCGIGTSGLPVSRGVAGSGFSKDAKQIQLIDTLHRIDLWKRKTDKAFDIAELRVPDIGNPFGVLLDGVFVRSGCEDQHYCAQRIIKLLNSLDAPVVAEVGGGFGGMAYYLMRDWPRVTYVGFDLPETIALASYYLLSTFPDLRATLYGEADLGQRTLQSSQIVLMPCFTIPEMPACSVDVTFNARLFFDLPAASLQEYLGEIVRITRRHFLHLNQTGASSAADAWFRSVAPEFERVEMLPSEWNDARTTHPNEMEYLYRRRFLE